MKEYNQKHHQEQNEWRREHPAQVRKYSQTQRLRNPELCNGYSKKWRKEHPAIVKAEHQAQRNTSLVGQKCAICDTIENVERHHPDYSKPLEVVFLCTRHHGKIRRFEQK